MTGALKVIVVLLSARQFLASRSFPMSIQAEQVRRLITRSHAILFGSLKAELSRAIACCRVAKTTSDAAERFRYLLVAEATSAKFIKLLSQGKIGKSKTILRLMSLLEKELGGRLYIARVAKGLPFGAVIVAVTYAF